MTAELLHDALMDDPKFHHWKNKKRSEISDQLGPIVIEFIRNEAAHLDPKDPVFLILMVVAEAMGDVLAQTLRKISGRIVGPVAPVILDGMVDQLRICAQDYLERTKGKQ